MVPAARLVPGVVPDLPAPTPVKVRPGAGGVAGALAGVNDGRLGSFQSKAAEPEQDGAICLIRWAAWPTEVIPARLPDAVAAACRILANSSSS